LAFLGITDVEFVYAEGLNMGEARKETALAEAEGRPAALTLSDDVTTAI
jgi:FMN-dependent NADH-azoreductase